MSDYDQDLLIGRYTNLQDEDIQFLLERLKRSRSGIVL
jgi:hypothetical protein